MAMDEEDRSICDDFPTDALAEILQRLPPNSRRRSRLVCRQWRDTVNEGTTTDLRNRAKTLLVSRSEAFVLDDKWALKQVMTGRVKEVVGTCNGLICLCDKSNPGGAISLTNLANKESIDLPPLPCADNFMRGRSRWHTAYGFAYHQGTGRYKVVRIPCCSDGQLDTVQVFTLGETSWRDVAAPTLGSTATRCLRLVAGIVSVDGAVYWVADGTERIMSFDLEDERVKFVKPLPVPLPSGPRSTFHLAEVYGRLGVAIMHGSANLEEIKTKTDVWVLESARGEQRWRRWYGVEMSRQPPQLLTLPHFAHGDHVLTRGDGKNRLYRHELKGTRERSSILQITQKNKGTKTAKGNIYQTFAYVETKEPLSIYKLW